MKNLKLEKMILQLPPELRQEVEDYVAFLSARYIHKITTDKIKFEWEGSLEQFRKTYGTIEFQNLILEWWEAYNVPD